MSPGRYGACPSPTRRVATRRAEPVLAALEAEGRIALRYCTMEGELSPDANPNGSRNAIAGIYGGAKKNVFGLMPHPERISDPVLGGVDGRQLFDAILSS